MIAKDKLIDDLENVKLVIGNGFDLYCDLKTSYSDFFRHDESKLVYFEKWLKRFSGVAKSYLSNQTNECECFWPEFLNFDKVSVWDLYFYIVSSVRDSTINEWRWCDVESKITESLKNDKSDYIVSWPSVFQIMNGAFNSENNSTASLILAGVVKRKNNGKAIASQKEFYKFLLSQLKQFEKTFGRYIFCQHYDDTNKNFNIVLQNEIFKFASEATIKKLCNIDKLVSIDSFNFDFVEVERLRKIFHNVNGNIEAPIFGIDSDTFDASDPRFIFSKTRRRMELDAHNAMVDVREGFDNVVIFGHSLNKADYSYFFSLLDMVDISNLEKDSTIVFSFSVYDESKRDEICFSFQDSISRLFHDYSIFRGNANNPNRLLDSLTIQKKVIIREIPYPNKG